MDYPGGITIRWDTFVNYPIDVEVSLCHHGFERLLFVNGHGSNHHLVERRDPRPPGLTRSNPGYGRGRRSRRSGCGCC